MSAKKKLTRSLDGKMLGGVCAGLANYLDIDVTLVRLIFVIILVLGVGSPVLLYFLLWVIMPVEGSPRAMSDTAAPTDPPAG